MSDDHGSVQVVDASVGVKWLLLEDLTPHADALYRNSLRNGRLLYAPAVFPNEVTNAIYQWLRRGLTTNDKAQELVARFLGLTFVLRSPANLPQRAFTFARTHNLPSIYDSLYVVLAQDIGTELWTADQRLLYALGGAAPWVRWIGDDPAA